jgi:hypothetical protein
MIMNLSHGTEIIPQKNRQLKCEFGLAYVGAGKQGQPCRRFERMRSTALAMPAAPLHDSAVHHGRLSREVA